MTDLSPPVIFLSGAGGGLFFTTMGMVVKSTPDPSERILSSILYRNTLGVSYPGWRRFVSKGFSTEVLISDLVREITVRVPEGPIRIVGVSIGAHFGCAVALRLRAMGREVAGFCAIDPLMAASSAPSSGWQGRAIAEGWALLSSLQLRAFAQFLRSRFWRGLSRLAGGHLPWLLQSFARWFPAALSLDPVLEEELNMRFLIRETAPWIASLDRNTTALDVPAILLRTSLAVKGDATWRLRCPKIRILEIPGQHHTIFDSENAETLQRVFVDATREWC